MLYFSQNFTAFRLFCKEIFGFLNIFFWWPKKFFEIHEKKFEFLPEIFEKFCDKKNSRAFFRKFFHEIFQFFVFLKNFFNFRFFSAIILFFVELFKEIFI